MIPESLQPVVAAIGPAATASIIQVYSGGELWVPQAHCLDENQPLVQLIGMPLAIRLAHAVGGRSLRIPIGKSLVRHLRSQEMINRWRKGLTISAIADLYCLTERQVYYIVGRCAAQTTQDCPNG